MKKALLAMEDGEVNDEAIVATPAEELPEETAAISQELTEVSADQNQLVEAADISDSLDGYADMARESTQPGEGGEEAPGFTDEQAEAVEVAMEHFRKRLGITRLKMPAMEAYSTDRVNTTKLALEEIQNLQARLDKKLSLAQEGLGGRITNAIRRTFKTNKGMRNEIRNLNIDALDKEPRSLGEPAWGRIFSLFVKQGEKADAAVVLKTIQLYNHSSEGKLKEVIKAASTALDEIDRELKRQMIGSADGAVSSIAAHEKKVLALCEGLRSELPGDYKENAFDIEVISCDRTKFKAIAHEIEVGAHTTEIERLYSKYLWSAYELDISRQPTGGIAGAVVDIAKLAHADRRAAMKAVRNISRELDSIMEEFLSSYQKAVWGAYRYLTVSAK